ncbi:MAG: amino acid ABC transporter permease [Acetobacteraceae bacterium]|nr:amino acid ABC transporter permease [Acetobacteraceae bacterium]
MGYTIHFGQVAPYFGYLLGGAGISLVLAGLAFSGGLLIGAFGAAGLTWGGPILRRIVRCYVVFFTNTPALVQVYFLYFVLPEWGVLLNSFDAVLIGLTVNAGAYLTEVERAGFASVHQAELDAAETMGMSLVQTVWYVIVPHAVLTLYPPLTGQFILIILGSSMGAVFGVEELTGRAFSVNAETFRSIEIFTIAGLLYVLVTFIASLLLAAAGRTLFRAKVGLI